MATKYITKITHSPKYVPPGSETFSPSAWNPVSEHFQSIQLAKHRVVTENSGGICMANPEISIFLIRYITTSELTVSKNV